MSTQRNRKSKRPAPKGALTFDETNSLLPVGIPIPGATDGALYLNATAVLEISRMYTHDTPRARELLDAYHTAEAETAATHPDWSEGKIRNEAFVLAARRLGWKVVER